MNEEDRRFARAGTRSFVDDLESLGPHRVERALRALYAKCDVCNSRPAPISIDGFLNGRIGTERFQQLNQVKAIADSQQRLADLVVSRDFFPMNLAKTQQFVRPDLVVEVAVLYGDSDVVDKLNSGNCLHFLIDIDHLHPIRIRSEPGEVSPGYPGSRSRSLRFAHE